MNPIAAFFEQHMIVVFFLYGLVFFVMGMALALASRQESQLHFVKTIRPLAAFGILHGIHEWIYMFQLIALQTSVSTTTPMQEAGRLSVLVVSFIMLLLFGVLLAEDAAVRLWRFRMVLVLIGVWFAAVGAAKLLLQPDASELIVMADSLARYILGLPGTLLGATAMMLLHRTFREYDMPQFGRDLIWCAAALFFYGIVGQIFVRETALPPSHWLNSELFLHWFGFPIQLFRASMAALLTYNMLRVLRVLDLENRRRLEHASKTQIEAQSRALEAERRINNERELLHQEI